MSLEIERKFLVKGDYKSFSHQHVEIAQGYLSSVPERSVRVRIKGDQGFLTVKGIGSDGGVSRFEWEKEISLTDARDLLQLCEAGKIEKIRYLVEVENHIFEVDEFSGDNAGLVVAEVELSAVDEQFEKPNWLGEEVTGVEKYYNSALSRNPFKNWK